MTLRADGNTGRELHMVGRMFRSEPTSDVIRPGSPPASSCALTSNPTLPPCLGSSSRIYLVSSYAAAS
jgi:hypothetical protein